MGTLQNIKAAIEEKKEQERIAQEEYEAKRLARAERCCENDIKKIPEIIQMIAESDKVDKKDNYLTSGEIIYRTKSGKDAVRRFDILPCPIQIMKCVDKDEKGKKHITYESEDYFKDEYPDKLDPYGIYYTNDACLLRIETPNGETHAMIAKDGTPISVCYTLDDDDQYYEFGDNPTETSAAKRYDMIDDYLEAESSNHLISTPVYNEFRNNCSTYAKIITNEIYTAYAKDGEYGNDVTVEHCEELEQEVLEHLGKKFEKEHDDEDELE